MVIYAAQSAETRRHSQTWRRVSVLHAEPEDHQDHEDHEDTDWKLFSASSPTDWRACLCTLLLMSVGDDDHDNGDDDGDDEEDEKKTLFPPCSVV